MRRPLLLLAVPMAIVACSGGSSKSLSVGTYVIADAATQQDACQALGDLTQSIGTIFMVDAVTSTGITFDFNHGSFAALRAGDTFSSSVTYDIDWTDTASSGLVAPYDCQERDAYAFDGTITGHDKASFSEDVKYDDSSGNVTDCIAANASHYGITIATWPCESKGTFDGVKQ